jgi:hypothetical protein
LLTPFAECVEGFQGRELDPRQRRVAVGGISAAAAAIYKVLKRHPLLERSLANAPAVAWRWRG